MTSQYKGFAYVYDKLMGDVDYKAWVNYVEQIINNNTNKVNKILELACGTGNITIPLAKKGYNIVGVDISEDMLMIAKNKSMENNLNIFFIHQNMVDLELDKKFDCVLIMCDGVNYITDKDDLLKLFKKVYNILEDKGMFIFDISSAYKIKNILGNNTFGEDLDDVCYLWQNYFDEESQILEMDLTIFIKEGKCYRKEEEFHTQRAYDVGEVIKLLNKINFKCIKTYDEFNFDSHKDDSERIFFVAKR